MTQSDTHHAVRTDTHARSELQDCGLPMEAISRLLHPLSADMGHQELGCRHFCSVCDPVIQQGSEFPV